VIDLDPGMAFGTGQHETTRLCLAALEETLRPAARALDLGCGSGILGVAAAKLGAASVVALDIEEVAIEATRENATRNGVAAQIIAARGSLGPDWPLPEPPMRMFDLVLANIHAAAIIALAPQIAAALRGPGAVLVASGIVVDRLPDVLDALAAAGFTAPDLRAAGDWRTVIATLM
jgi:ribosomal protein L11 methyltransferase